MSLPHHRWTPPPGWPAPPPGWSPPPGWQPDPAWGPAPAGWQFWRAVEAVRPSATRPAAGALVAVGLAAGLLGLLVGGAAGALVVRGGSGTPEAAVVAPAPDAAGPVGASTATSATLTVHTDGCGVVRTGPDAPVDGLSWSVRDGDGFEVLQRNAEGETRYRYFQPGTFTVVLTAWGGRGYAPVSNEVTIRC